MGQTDLLAMTMLAKDGRLAGPEGRPLKPP